MSTNDPAVGVSGNEEISPVSPGSDVTGSSPEGSVGASPTPAPVIDWNTAPQQLRDAFQRTQAEYQQTKANLEKWEKLGVKPDDVSRSHQTYTTLYSEAKELGSTLGYSDKEVREAFQKDPVSTLATLRQMAQQAQPAQPSQQDIQRLLDKRLEERLRPFEVEREQRLEQEASHRFDGECGQQFKQSFPEGLPDSNRTAISGLAWSMLIDKPEAYEALRKGDASVVAPVFDQAKKLLLKIVADYNQMEKVRIQGKPQDRTPPVKIGKNITIDDIINRAGDLSIPQDQIFSGR